MSHEPRVCSTCVFFDGAGCEFRFEHTINVDKNTGVESCITKIDRFEGEDPRAARWTCCGGIMLGKEDKCSICGEKYDE